ncbi:hypothetical protein GOP47_0014218 [Adiantum capillus-veneris]|uniref:Uncharacterized protein n=1 Tax=Adiantum capillus-veneris TaxID=13818 RepID=A0A9D4UR15_ADICA|nr:hypothetical protein GOP47_0014218 [Adiantum capillus-veneris]
MQTPWGVRAARARDRWRRVLLPSAAAQGFGTGPIWPALSSRSKTAASSPPSPPPPPLPASSSMCPPPVLPPSPHAWKNVNSSSRLVSEAAPASSQPFLLNFRLQPPAPPPFPQNLMGDSLTPPLPPSHLLPNFRSPPGAPQPTQLLMGGGSSSSYCVASIGQSLHLVGLENSQEDPSKANNLLTEQLAGVAPLKLQYKQHLQQCKQQQRQPGGAGGGGNQKVQQYCSLFSVFGNGGLPLPIAQVAVAMAQKDGASLLPQVSGSQQLQAASTAFEFTACDFLRESLPLPAFAGTAPNRSAGAVEARRPVTPAPPEYCLFGQHKLVQNCPSMSSLQLNMPSPAPLVLPPPPPSVAPAPASTPLINALGAVPDLIQWPPLIRSTRPVLPQDHSKA